MKKDVKSSIIDILKQEGINHLFGYTGGHNMHLWEAANKAGFKLILNKQEGNAGYMADAFARVTGKPAVITGTAGPGATNMITALATAFLDSVPLIAFGANVGTTAFGKNAVQDGSGMGRATEQRLAFKAVCKQAMLAPSPESVPDLVRDAIREATSGRPGPVYLEIPSNFWNVEIEYQRLEPHQYKNTNQPLCNKKDCKVIEQKFYKSKHPLILIGEGSFEIDVQNKIFSLINKTGVPFGVSPLAKNVVDEFHSLYLGVMRQEGKTQKIYEYLKKSDFVLFLGDRMQEWETSWYDYSLFKQAKLAQVDPDPNEIGRVFPVDYSAVGSVSSFIDNINLKKHSAFSLLLKNTIDLWKKHPRHKRLKDGKGINPLNINNIAEDLASPESSIVTDTGYAKSMAIMKYRTKLNQYFVTADNNGPMGYSVPAALGVALATGKEVICFSGDGGFQMTLNELGTALNYKLKVIYIVENNGGCVSIVDCHTNAFGHSCADTFLNPDYVKLAEAYGMLGLKAETTEEFEEAFKKAQKAKTSVIIDAKIDQSIMVWE